MKVAILCILLALTGVAHAAEEQPMTISLSFSDVEIGEAMAAISEQGGVTLLGDPSVKGKVTCGLADVTVEQALETVCGINKLEWLRAYATPDSEGKLSATRLFELVDVIRGLGKSSLVYVDTQSQACTIFASNMKPGSIELSSITANLKLKPVYLVRAAVDPNAPKETEKPAGGQATGLMAAPPGDSKVAAEQLWGYFSQMPFEQRFEVMNEIGRIIKHSMNSEQREQMREQWRRKFDGGRPRGREGDGPPRGPQ